jgi:hypothetical protein
MIDRSHLLARLMRWRRGTPLSPAEPHLFDFDTLARDRAAGLSRREALRRLGGGVAGALLAALGLAPAAEAQARTAGQIR